jgi:hypothetical protein
MSEAAPGDFLNIQEMLFDSLNEHGFLFKEKCARLLEDSSIMTNWSLQSREFPVSADEKDTRIDIILKDLDQTGKQIYAVIECRRTNPLRAHWLFGNPITVDYYEPYFINLYSEHDHKGNYMTHFSQLKCPYNHMITYLIDNWWLEQGISNIKKYASPSPIEETFIHTLVGVSGLGEEISFQWNKRFLHESAIFIPVVITTAPLYVATYDLNEVNISTGTIDPDKVSFGSSGATPEKVRWLLINYSASRSISPPNFYDNISGETPAELVDFYKRSIFVVNSESIIDFFSELHWGGAGKQV